MLGRLIKYDMKSVSRLGIPLSAIALVAAIMGAAALKIVVNAPDNASGIPLVVCIMFVVAAFIAIFAYMVVIWILLLHRFYTNMFTDEGYLTFTLPVKPATLILSKLMSAVIWSVASFLVFGICILIIITFGTGSGFANFSWFDGIKELADSGILGFNLLYIPVFLVYMLVATVFSYLLIYLSITIAAVITRKNKILVAIGMYYGINMIVSLFTTLGELIPMATISNPYEATAEIAGQITLTGISINTAIYVVFAAVAFVICNELMKRKLNLD